MKFLLLLPLLICSFFSIGQSCTFGHIDQTGQENGYFNPSVLFGMRVFVAEPGELQSLNIVGLAGGISNDYTKMALYSDELGNPDSLLAQTQPAMIPLDGFIEFDATQVYIDSGYYWIMGVYDEYDSHVEMVPDSTTIFYTSLPFQNNFPNVIINSSTSESWGYFKYSLTIACEPLSTPEYLGKSKKYQIYPNPSNDAIIISGLSYTSDFVIKNNLGISVGSGMIASEEKLDVSFLSPGLYYILIDSYITLEFIKE